MARARALWVALPLIAVVDLLLQVEIASGGPAASDLASTAALVRQGYDEGDLVVVAPPWLAEARVVLGPRVMPLRDQARPDEDVYRRLWEVSTRGASAPEARGLTPELERRFGEVTVRRFVLRPRAVQVHDFVDRLDDAAISAEDRGRRRSCRRTGNRWRCERGPTEAWVGTETIADLDHRPRRCVWAHPLSGGRRLRIEYSGVQRGATVEGHTATDYVVGRHCSTRPVDLSVEIDGASVGSIRHLDCDGWRAFDFAVPAGADEVDVAFVVSAPDPRQRHFCFQAQMRRPP